MDLISHRTCENIFAEHIFARHTTNRLQRGRVDAAVFQRDGVGDVEADDPADDQTVADLSHREDLFQAALQRMPFPMP
jgi:hypothetical protein